jgi:hypothetical protein
LVETRVNQSDSRSLAVRPQLQAVARAEAVADSRSSTLKFVSRYVHDLSKCEFSCTGEFDDAFEIAQAPAWIMRRQPRVERNVARRNAAAWRPRGSVQFRTGKAAAPRGAVRGRPRLVNMTALVVVEAADQRQQVDW